MLTVRKLEAGYGDFQALFGVDFEVAEGEAVALIGANGAGKSTLLKTLAGQVRCRPEAVCLDGRPIGGIASQQAVRLGIALVPEGRRLFASLSVEENLRCGLFAGRRGAWTLERVHALFPVLRERRRQPATTLSGGQQQMVAIGRALLSNPRLLLCDEVSLGLSPAVVKDIHAALPQIRAQGTSVVLVEQDIAAALRSSSRAYCMVHGRVTLQGDSRDLTREQVSAAYFGHAAGSAASHAGASA